MFGSVKSSTVLDPVLGPVRAVRFPLAVGRLPPDRDPRPASDPRALFRSGLLRSDLLRSDLFRSDLFRSGLACEDLACEALACSGAVRSRELPGRMLK
jgi:hypothetical protein